jgi:hypothetical protein
MFNTINLRRLVFAGVLLLAFTSLKAQTVKPAFKQLIIADYKVDTIKGHQELAITRYLEIKETGQLHIKAVYSYDNSIVDSTYQLPDAELSALNKILGRGLPLKTYMITEKDPPGATFGGSLVYITCTYTNGNTENFIWVYPFMDANFNAAFAFRLKWPRNKTASGKKIIDLPLEAGILKMHNACTYLPRMNDRHPPTVRELKVADPAAKQ